MTLPQTLAHQTLAGSRGGADVVVHVRLPVRASPHYHLTENLSDGAERLLTNGCS